MAYTGAVLLANEPAFYTSRMALACRTYRMDVVSFRDVRAISGGRRNYPSFQIMARRASDYFFDVSAQQLHHGVVAGRRCHRRKRGPVPMFPVRTDGPLAHHQE